MSVLDTEDPADPSTPEPQHSSMNWQAQPGRAERSLRAIFKHWNEFGPEHGFGELIDRLQREPLTDEQIKDAARQSSLDWHRGWQLGDGPNRYTLFARAIEGLVRGDACEP